MRIITWRQWPATAPEPAWLMWMSRPASSASPSSKPPRFRPPSNIWARAKCSSSMLLDAVTVRNLELIEPVFADDVALGKSATLLGVLDQTATGMGGRLLRQRLLRPSLNQPEIEARLDAVGELLGATILRAELRKELAGVLDLERLLAKVTIGSAGPRDLLALGKSLERIPLLKQRAQNRESARLQALCAALDDVPEVRERILAA